MSLRKKNNNIIKRLQKCSIPINSRSEIPDAWFHSEDRTELLTALKTKPRPIPSIKCHVVDLNELDKFKHLL